MHFLHNIQTFIGTDKAAHFALSYLMTDLGSHLGLAKPISAFFTMLLGIGKEFFVDSRVDGMDIIADGMGVLFAMFI